MSVGQGQKRHAAGNSEAGKFNCILDIAGKGNGDRQIGPIEAEQVPRRTHTAAEILHTAHIASYTIQFPSEQCTEVGRAIEPKHTYIPRIKDEV